MSNDFIPSLSDNLSISRFDAGSYLLCIDNDEPVKLRISPVTKMLIDQIDGKKNMEEITHAFNESTGASLQVPALTKILADHLAGYGVLQNDHKTKIRARDQYLKLRLNLLPRKYVQRLASLLSCLFNKKIFVLISVTCFVFLTVMFIRFCDMKSLYNDLSIFSTSSFILLNIIGIMLHELGHAAACEKFGAKTGAIGFGFYLFTPVFYTDVSDAWRLKQRERLIVDLAGIYMQMIFCVILAVIYIFSGKILYLNASFLIAFTILITMSPFLRYDGYWALTDLLNVPNLRANSNRKLWHFGRWFTGKENNWHPSGLNIFLACYALVSSMIIIYFLFFVIFYNSHSVIYFPVNVFNLVEKLLTGFSQMSFDWMKTRLAELFLPFLFYLFVYKMVKNKLTIFLKSSPKITSA